MASEYSDLPQFLATRTGEAYDAQFSTSDYGRVGDQRPYQIVQPSYPAPKFLSRFAYLESALRECGTLCQTTGQPFRLVKWGARIPCYPCRGPAKTANLLPRYIRSPGALAGHPDAQPIAEFQPGGGTVVYGPDGQPTVVGAPNFVVSRTPDPGYVDYKTSMPVRYVEAVKTAQYLAGTTGRNAFICSSLGASCKGRNPKKWVPVVYVSPGGLVRRYREDLPMPPGVNSAPGSITAVSPVTEDEFRELIRESAGASRLAQGV